MGNKAIDFGEDRFPFATERVQQAIEYARAHGLTREWRDDNPAGEGLVLRVGPAKASYYARHRVDGKMTSAKLGPADGPGKLSVDAARRELQRHRFGQPSDTATTTRRGKKAAPGWTVGEVYAKYIEAHAAGEWSPGSRARPITDTTVSFYRNLHRAHLAPHDDLALDDFASRMAAIHKSIRATAPRQADCFRQLVKNVYQYATDLGLWDRVNPAVGSRATGLIPKHQGEVRTRTLDDAEWRKLDRAMKMEDDPMWRDLFTMSITTLQRMGAVSRMRWADIKKTRDGLVWQIPAKFMKGRKAGHTVPLHVLPDALDIISRREKVVGDTSEYVFPAPRDPSVPVTTYKNAWKRVIKRAGLWSADRDQRPRPHDLRRTGGERLTTEGTNLQQVTRALGNSPASAPMVARVYAGVSDAALVDAFSASAKAAKRATKKPTKKPRRKPR